MLESQVGKATGSTVLKKRERWYASFSFEMGCMLIGMHERMRNFFYVHLFSRESLDSLVILQTFESIRAIKKTTTVIGAKTKSFIHSS